MTTTKELVQSTFNELQNKHQFTCVLSENPPDNFMMEFAYEINAIVYDSKKLEETYKQGVQAGVYMISFEVFILFCLVHELGHFYDYQDNKDAFNFTNKQEYIQMELNGIEKAKRIIPIEHYREFHFFNQHIIQSYESLDMETVDGILE